jgi:peptide/nickel transport system permease protein
LALIVALAIGIPAGVLAGLFRGTPLDTGISVISALALGVPYFWLGVLLILLFAIFFKILPPSGYVAFTESPIENLKLMILPALTIGLHVAALVVRQTRASILQVLTHEYVRTAYAKGLRRSVVIRRHILRNALIPVITLVGLQLGNMLGGAIITETIFSIPGIGTLIVSAVSARDFPVVQSGVLLIVLLVVVVNLITDILYAYIDPRIKVELIK